MAKCRVSYTDREGIHSVEVTADTLYEAVAQAIADFREDKTVSNPPGRRRISWSWSCGSQSRT